MLSGGLLLAKFSNRRLCVSDGYLCQDDECEADGVSSDVCEHGIVSGVFGFWRVSCPPFRFGPIPVYCRGATARTKKTGNQQKSAVFRVLHTFSL